MSLKAFNYVVSVSFMLTISYTLCKILMFSEDENQLKFPGIWMSVWSTFTLSTIHFLLWFFYIQTKRKTRQEDDGYTRMAENGHVQG